MYVIFVFVSVYLLFVYKRRKWVHCLYIYIIIYCDAGNLHGVGGKTLNTSHSSLKKCLLFIKNCD